MIRVLVVGAGFAGATHARELAESGFAVDVIDARDHIGGNAFDCIDATGIRLHKYGPHLFHTNNEEVIKWLQRFGRWQEYQHRVRAVLPDGRTVPLPINLDSLSIFANKTLHNEDEAVAFIESQRVRIEHPGNAAEYLYSKLGVEITDSLFRPYSEKMWDLKLEQLASSVVQRVAIRFDHDDRYFPNDRFQILPRDGYTSIFQAILRHENIRAWLGVKFDHEMSKDYNYTFASVPIDEYFDFAYGELPYRSIRFHRHVRDVRLCRQQVAIHNYTDRNKFTRETSWHLLPNNFPKPEGEYVVTVEEPCSYKENKFERYYPVKTAGDIHNQTYLKYASIANELDNIQFIGRCGTYQYLDMHQVINQSLQSARRFVGLRM